MQFSFALFTALVASVSAAVLDTRAPEGTLEKRQDLTVIMCKDLGLRPGPTGGCTSITTANNGCYGNFKDLAKDGGNWNDQVTSAAPAQEGGRRFFCDLFEHSNCGGRSVRLTGPAYDLRQQNFNDMASSVRCFYA